MLRNGNKLGEVRTNHQNQGPICFYCKGKGHLRRNHPQRSKDLEIFEEVQKGETKDQGCQGLCLLGTKYHREPLISLKLGPQGEEFEFLVDTGAERTCVCKIPKGCEKSWESLQVVGAKGEGFQASIIKRVIFKGNHKTGMGDILLVPGAECNLLGRDLQIQLGTGVLPKEGEMVVKLFKLKEDDEKLINPIVWAGPENQGKLDMMPIMVKITDKSHPIRVRQYPIYNPLLIL